MWVVVVATAADVLPSLTAWGRAASVETVDYLAEA
jgi:hypothetical protein